MRVDVRERVIPIIAGAPVTNFQIDNKSTFSLPSGQDFRNGGVNHDDMLENRSKEKQ
jgi:hypothetical protein